jgi:hypothetical protein
MAAGKRLSWFNYRKTGFVMFLGHVNDAQAELAACLMKCQDVCRPNDAVPELAITTRRHLRQLMPSDDPPTGYRAGCRHTVLTRASCTQIRRHSFLLFEF